MKLLIIYPRIPGVQQCIQFCALHWITGFTVVNFANITRIPGVPMHSILFIALNNRIYGSITLVQVNICCLLLNGLENPWGLQFPKHLLRHNSIPLWVFLQEKTIHFRIIVQLKSLIVFLVPNSNTYMCHNWITNARTQLCAKWRPTLHFNGP